MDRELKERGKVVERDELLIADHVQRNRPAALFREKRERRRRGRLTGQADEKKARCSGRASIGHGNLQLAADHRESGGRA